MRALAFSPDGHLLISATSAGPGALCFWNADTLQRIAAVDLPPKAGGVRAVAFSRDGTNLFTFGDSVVYWDVASRTATHQWHVNGHGFSFALSPDGQTLAIGRYTDRDLQKVLLEFHQSGSGKLIRSVEGRGETLRSVAFSPDGKLLAGAVQREDSEAISAIRVWDVATARQTSEFKVTHGGGMDLIAFAATGSDGPSTTRHFGWSTFHIADTDLDLLAGFSPFCVAANGDRAISRGPCGPTLRDLKSGAAMGTLDSTSELTYSVWALSPDGRTAIEADHAGTLTAWTTDRTRAAAAGRLPTLRLQLVLDRPEFLTGEAIGWRCRITNVSHHPVPVYAWPNAPQRSAIRLRLGGSAGFANPVGLERAAHGLARDSIPPNRRPDIAGTHRPTMLAPNESIELQFKPAGPDAIAAGGGGVLRLGDEARLNVARVEYLPPASALGDVVHIPVSSQPVAIVRDPGPAFSHPVYSDWAKSSDGAVAVRIHTDSALYGRQASIFLHGEVRNDSGHPLTIRVPQDDLYPSLHVVGPRGPVASLDRPLRVPRYITLDPGATAALYGPIGPEHFTTAGIEAMGEYAISFEYRSASTRADAPATLWRGTVTTPAIKVWRVPSLAVAPPEARRPAPQEASADRNER